MRINAAIQQTGCEQETCCAVSRASVARCMLCVLMTPESLKDSMRLMAGGN